MPKKATSPARVPHSLAGPGDRLSLTLFFALMLHAIVILGVSFQASPPHERHESSLDVTLVHSRSAKAPKRPDFLAQANQIGGGTLDKPAKPSTPLASPLPAPVPAVTPPPPQAPPPSEARKAPVRVITTQAPASHKARVSRPKEETSPAHHQHPSASKLISNSMQIASLSAEIERSMRAYAKRPRRRFVTANTTEARYAMYVEAWRKKIERIGNLNYPDEAKRRRLQGRLRLEVALNADGTINDIILRQSSGERVLDDAALRIVHLAAPFAPFPPDIRKETDILHIIRTWEFLSSSRLYTR